MISRVHSLAKFTFVCIYIAEKNHSISFGFCVCSMQANVARVRASGRAEVLRPRRLEESRRSPDQQTPSSLQGRCQDQLPQVHQSMADVWFCFLRSQGKAASKSTKQTPTAFSCNSWSVPAPSFLNSAMPILFHVLSGIQFFCYLCFYCSNLQSPSSQKF